MIEWSEFANLYADVTNVTDISLTKHLLEVLLVGQGILAGLWLICTSNSP